ncbi:MAG: ornithine cyclodeaminase family protein [Candidatus Bathyarchaeota archaeon]|nr:ornithine cyclodeaminase family protein [Candidatus Bathyarchaeota archaeon]
MDKVDFIYLSQEEILDLNIPMSKIIELVEQGLYEHGHKRVENPPKPGIHSKPDAFIHAMPAYYQKLGIGGLKWVSGYPTNRKLGLPQIAGLMLVNDMETGMPLAVMDCRWITAVRTAAVSAITAKYCAKKDTTSLGVVGCGVQGRMNIVALKEVIPDLHDVGVFDINSEAMKRYKEDFETELDVSIKPAKSVKEAVDGKDMILTATQRLPEPLVKNEWFKPGCLGFGLEASRAWYGDAILECDKFVTDSWDQTVYFYEHGAFPDGLPTLHAELGEVVAGVKPGRESDKERILAINIGLALEDVIVADYIYKVAKDGDHQRLTLMESDF